MGSIDGEKYPDIDAQAAVEIADLLVNTFGGEPSSEEAFAQEVGHKSSDSGAYRGKIADVRRYGILPSRGLSPTDLAHRVANPRNDEEERKAMFEMYRNISLFSKLYNHLDGQTPNGDFWRILTEITTANPADAREEATEIEKKYREMLRYEPKNDTDESDSTYTSSNAENPSAAKQQSATIPENGIFVQIDGDQLQLNSVSETNLEMARMFIQSKKQELSAGENSENKSGKSNGGEQMKFGQ
jgi:hypothetical protein